jgi:hypothetical protein
MSKTDAPIFLIVGRKGSGKDTVAAYFDLKHHRTSFAHHIKTTLTHLFQFPSYAYFDDQDKKEKLWPEYCATHTPRELMVWFGTEVMREKFGPNFWIDRLAKNIPDNRVTFVTDTRFPNEVTEMIDRFPGRVRVIYVEADERIGPLVSATASPPELAVIHTRDMLLTWKKEDNCPVPVTFVINNHDLGHLHHQLGNNMHEYI